MEHPLSIANYFIAKSLVDGVDMTPMKLLKLIYIAHGWHLALNDGEPLIDEAVEAWQYGPVVPSVYHEFKEYGNTPIRKLSTIYNNRSHVLTPVISNDKKEFLDKIWEVYKKYDGLELSTLTHQKGTPWDIVWNDLGGNKKKSVQIPDKLIEEHYKIKNSVPVERYR